MSAAPQPVPVRRFPPSYQWRGIPYCAKLFGRTRRRIRQWCVDGTFAVLDIPTFQDSSNRWWVLLSEDKPAV